MKKIIYHIHESFVVINFFLLRNIFKVDLFNIFTLFNTVSYLKLNIKLKIDQKFCTYKNLDKTPQNIWQPHVWLFHLMELRTMVSIQNKLYNLGITYCRLLSF